MLHSHSKQAEKTFCIPLFFSQLFLFASAFHSVLFLSQMNYGLNARTNVLCTIYDENIEKKREKEDARCMREREFFFSITVEKWKQNGDIEERKIRAARHFICFFLLVSVAHSIGHGHEHRAASNNCTNNYDQQFNGKKNIIIIFFLMLSLMSLFYYLFN